MPIYMNYNDIKGDATADGHAGWIELQSFNWGVSRDISAPTGAAADRESSAPTLHEVVVTKNTDSSSPKLLNEAYQGDGQKVVIDFCKTDKGKLVVYLTLTLEDAMVSGHQFSSSGGSKEDASNRPVESLTISYTKVEFKNTPMDDKGGPGSPDSVTYDVALGKVV